MDWEVKHVVGSSNVLGIGYNEKIQEIGVLFQGSTTLYFYEKCSREEWEEFKEARSKGKYVHAVLRKKKFRSEPLWKQKS